MTKNIVIIGPKTIGEFLIIKLRNCTYYISPEKIEYLRISKSVNDKYNINIICSNGDEITITVNKENLEEIMDELIETIEYYRNELFRKQLK